MEAAHELKETRQRKLSLCFFPYRCQLLSCGFLIGQGRNLRSHLQHKHLHFLKFRADFENTDEKTACKNTYIELIKECRGIPKEMLQKYEEKASIELSFKKDKGKKANNINIDPNGVTWPGTSTAKSMSKDLLGIGSSSCTEENAPGNSSQQMEAAHRVENAHNRALRPSSRPYRCELQSCGDLIRLGKNLHLHLESKHLPFLKFRADFENTDKETACNNTYIDLIKKRRGIPEEILQKFEEKASTEPFVEKDKEKKTNGILIASNCTLWPGTSTAKSASKDSLALEPSSACEDPLGLEPSSACEDPLGLGPSSACEDPLGLGPSSACEDPLGLGPSSACEDPLGLGPSSACEDPLGLGPSSACEDPLGLGLSSASKDLSGLQPLSCTEENAPEVSSQEMETAHTQESTHGRTFPSISRPYRYESQSCGDLISEAKKLPSHLQLKHLPLLKFRTEFDNTDKEAACNNTYIDLTKKQLGPFSSRAETDGTATPIIHYECKACEAMTPIIKPAARQLQSARTACNCLVELLSRCQSQFRRCCLKLLKQFTEPQVCHQKVNVENSFLFLNNRYYCPQCRKFPTKKPSSTRCDLAFRGMFHTDRAILRYRLKRHLFAQQHKRSLAKEKEEEKIAKEKIDSEKYIENLLISGQYMANNAKSCKFFPNFVEVMQSVGQNIPGFENCSRSLGNEKLAQIACYDTCVKEMKLENARKCKVTGLTHRFMISVDESIAPKDVSRQAVVGTRIDKNGMPKEFVLSAAATKDKHASGACNQLKKELSKFIDTKDMAVVSTDGASVYAGPKGGMYDLMRHDDAFTEKLLCLADVCYRCELWVFANVPNWVLETISQSKALINQVNQSLTISRIVKHYGEEFHVPYFAEESHSNARFIEHGHDHFSSILRNIEILKLSFSSIINDDKYDGLSRYTARELLNIVSNTVFIARVMLLDRVFSDISSVEKEAQSKTFGPFDLRRVLHKLKTDIRMRRREPLNDVESFLRTGIMQYSYQCKMTRVTKSKTGITHYSYRCKMTRVSKSKTSKFVMRVGQPEGGNPAVIEDYKSWIDMLLENFEKYLELPKAVSLATDIFSYPTNFAVGDRIKLFRQFFSMINSTFERCRKESCQVETCECVEVQFRKFWSHFVMMASSKQYDLPTTQVDRAVESEDDGDGGTGFNHSLSYKNLQYPSDKFMTAHKVDFKKLFAFYLSEENLNEVKNLEIVNITRALEIVQLLKASQFATKRVASFVEKLLENGVQLVYEYRQVRPGTCYDMVNITTVIANNANIKTLNLSLAKKIFLTKRMLKYFKGDMLLNVRKMDTPERMFQGEENDVAVPRKKAKSNSIMVLEGGKHEACTKKKAITTSEDEEFEHDGIEEVLGETEHKGDIMKLQFHEEEAYEPTCKDEDIDIKDEDLDPLYEEGEFQEEETNLSWNEMESDAPTPEDEVEIDVKEESLDS